ncbi:transglutaminase domain-containing protein [Candidatus Bathyarchaeota archaeon]|nr:transglutaminase domain-containing protein [Candidatus Bathyarchaeota archaeon]
MKDPLYYYSKPSPLTYLPEEKEITNLLRDIPETVPGVVEAVQNTLLHIFWAERYGERLTEKRTSEVNIRSAADMLRRAAEIRKTSLSDPRRNSEKVIGNCRDFSVLSVALMRRKGIPSRARCGFGAYFSTPDMKLRYIDHWVVEYWKPENKKWVMVDSQLDKFQRTALSINFDPLDVPHDMFLTGGHAWKVCRKGEADPETFGIMDMSGMDFILGDMVRDLAALNKTPLLPWDCWGLMLEEEIRDYELLDNVSDATLPGTMEYELISELNQHPRLKVPHTIVSWMGGTDPFEVKLSEVTERIPHG